MTNFYKLCGLSMLTFVLADCTILSANKSYDCAHDGELIVHIRDISTNKEVGTIINITIYS